MKKNIMLFFILLAPTILFGQSDSIKNKKNEISIGTPMFPFLYTSIGGFGIGRDIGEAPSLGTNIMKSTPFFFPVNISYNRSLNDKNRLGIGVDVTKAPEYYDKDIFYYLIYAGIRHKVCSTPSRIKTYLNCYLSGGNIQFGFYPWTGGHHNIGAIRDGNIVFGGINLGLSFQYFITQNIFLESETMLLGYYGKVNGYVYDTSYINSKKPIFLDAYGVTFEKLIGINVGYNF